MTTCNFADLKIGETFVVDAGKNGVVDERFVKGDARILFVKIDDVTAEHYFDPRRKCYGDGYHCFGNTGFGDPSPCLIKVKI